MPIVIPFLFVQISYKNLISLSPCIKYSNMKSMLLMVKFLGFYTEHTSRFVYTTQKHIESKPMEIELPTSR